MNIEELRTKVESLEQRALEIKEAKRAEERKAAFYNNNFKGFSDKLNAVKDASAAYNNFAGKADAMDGDVSFVIETDEIK